MKYNGEKNCPVCGKPIYGYAANSRKDYRIEICDTCGLVEAYEVFINNYSANKNKESS